MQKTLFIQELQNKQHKQPKYLLKKERKIIIYR